MISILRQGSVALEANSDHHSLARLNLLQIANSLIINIHLRCQHNHRHAGHNQSQGAMLQLASSISLSMNIGNLLQLQRTLQSNCIIQAATQEEGILAGAILAGKNLDLVHILQHLVNLLGNGNQPCCQSLRLILSQGATQATNINSQH